MTTLTPSEQAVREACKLARKSAQTLATLPTARLDEMLDEIAAELEKDREAIFAANAKDIAACEKAGLHASLIDRLRITEKTLASMVKGVRQVRALAQPLGQKMSEWTRPNGIAISKRPGADRCHRHHFRVPPQRDHRRGRALPQDRQRHRCCAAARRRSTPTARWLQRCRNCPSLPPGAVQLVADTDRALVPFLCRQERSHRDVIIPRGGHSADRNGRKPSRAFR